MITYYYKSIKDRKLHAIEQFKTGAWISVENPSEEEQEFLVSKFKLEEGLLHDALDPYEVPRLEVDEGIIYIYTRVPTEEEGNISTVPLLIAVGKNFVATISRRPLPFQHTFVSGLLEFSTTQKTKLVLLLFTQVNAAYQRFITNISRRVRSISGQVQKVNTKDIAQFVSYETLLNDFLAALIPTRTVLRNLLSGKVLKLYEEDEDLVEDLTLSNRQLIELGKSSLKNIVNIRDAYSTIMTHDLNRIIKLFTALTVILTAPMVISSFYGMNVSLPLAGAPGAFWFIFGATSLISFILLIIFARNHWL